MEEKIEKKPEVQSYEYTDCYRWLCCCFCCNFYEKGYQEPNDYTKEYQEVHRKYDGVVPWCCCTLGCCRMKYYEKDGEESTSDFNINVWCIPCMMFTAWGACFAYCLTCCAGCCCCGKGLDHNFYTSKETKQYLLRYCCCFINPGEVIKDFEE